MGGLIGATVLTVFFVPALYAAWFGVTRTVTREISSSTSEPASLEAITAK
jgi:multidrug efflux pump